MSRESELSWVEHLTQVTEWAERALLLPAELPRRKSSLQEDRFGPSKALSRTLNHECKVQIVSIMLISFFSCQLLSLLRVCDSALLAREVQAFVA